MEEEKSEGLPLEEDGGISLGYKRFEGETEEESALSEEEPEKEPLEGGGEEESEEEVEEPGDEEEEEEESLPKVSKELEEERKNLLRSYTEKMKEVAGLRLKARLVDAIEANPEETLLELARRFNVKLPKEEEKKPLSGISLSAPKVDEDLPSYIGRAIQEIVPQAVEEAMGKTLQSLKGEKGKEYVKESEIQGILDYLDSKYSDWGLYEKEMANLALRHPTLARDPDELYRLAKVSSLDTRKIAKSKKERGRKKVQRSGERSSKPVLTTAKGKKLSFNEAWELAKREATKV